MILIFLSALSFAEAQSCCGKAKDVSSQFATIQNQMTAPGTCITHEESKLISEEVKPFSDLEVMARLVYAETFATKCTNVPTEGMMDGIATIIANRTKQPAKYGRGLRGVIFKPAQYNSSLSTNPNNTRSEFKRFLCPVSNPRDPKQVAMWEYAQAAARKAMNPKTSNFLGGSDVTLVYYFKYFLPKTVKPPCFMDPASPNRVVNPPGTDRACIGFFYDKACAK